MRVKISDILKKGSFDTYSEFYLGLYAAKILREFGYVADLSDMRVDKSVLPEKALNYFKYLCTNGFIYLGDLEYEGSAIQDAPDVDVDVSYFMSEKMYKVEGENAYWSFEYAKENYSVDNYEKFRTFEKLGSTLLSLVAYYVVKKYLGREDTNFLQVSISDEWSRNMFMVTNIYSCMKGIKVIDELVSLDLAFYSSNETDLDYQVFCSNSYMSGRMTPRVFSEKVKLFDECDIGKGSILLMFFREGMCESNPYGHIESSKVIRLDEIGDSYIGYTEISINKTKEEVMQDYLGIDPDIRYMFSDMVNKGPVTTTQTKGLENVGIEENFFDEEYILTKIDPYATVEKIVTIEGKEAVVNMSEIDAIYWLLKQYNVEFDDLLYREMYATETGLLWDAYGN